MRQREGGGLTTGGRKGREGGREGVGSTYKASVLSSGRRCA